MYGVCVCMCIPCAMALRQRREDNFVQYVLPHFYMNSWDGTQIVRLEEQAPSCWAMSLTPAL